MNERPTSCSCSAFGRLAPCSFCIDGGLDICGFCGEPFAEKIPHEIRWPGEEAPGSEFVHEQCEREECERASLALTQEQRDAFLMSLK